MPDYGGRVPPKTKILKPGGEHWYKKIRLCELDYD